jgi:formate dehydrogenase maturation protein FdhE
MGEIKSAAEIAKEKLAKIGEPTEEERLKWKYGPVGEKLAAVYLKENVNLVTELQKYDVKAGQVIIAGVNDILLRNISLPRNDAAQRINKKAMEGIKSLKEDKIAVENVFSRLRQVFEHYTQEGDKQKKQAYESLKAEFEEKLQEAVRKQTGVDGKINIDVESQPQFQSEWQRMQAQMEGQYTNLLEECKKELASIK